MSLFLLEKFNTVITIQQSPSDINRRLLSRIMYVRTYRSSTPDDHHNHTTRSHTPTTHTHD